MGRKKKKLNINSSTKKNEEVEATATAKSRKEARHPRSSPLHAALFSCASSAAYPAVVAASPKE
jgi:hypothetical protein